MPRALRSETEGYRTATEGARVESAVARVARKLARRAREAGAEVPRIDSFLDFLTHHARVKSGSSYVPYHFNGREALLPIVRQLDALLAAGEPDASLALCGGAQFGKTVLMLNLLAYLVAVRFRNVGYYLPDDDLVAGLVDGKLRPDVLDQVPWLARLLQVGKTLAPTGRAVNRKGAFLCTDGRRSALAFMRGLGKIPTSFSMDVVIQDEKDDLPEKHARFLSGRMTASDLRLTLLIGTQRYHGAGQNLAFTEGTQHIGLLRCPGCGARHNPETAWPGVCRLRLDGMAPAETPRLGPEGNFNWPEDEGVEACCAREDRRRAAVTSSGAAEGPSAARADARCAQDDGCREGGGVGPSAARADARCAQDDGCREGGGVGPSTARADARCAQDDGCEKGGGVGPSTARADARCAQDDGGKNEERGVEGKGGVETPGEVQRALRSETEGYRTETEGYRADGGLRFPVGWSPGQAYYLGCLDCGTELDRTKPEWHALAPARAAQRRWSYRLSQLLFPDIDLAQIVAAWQLAIRDPAQMNVFCTDRLALPKSSSQTLTPHDLAAARGNYNLERRTKSLEFGATEAGGPRGSSPCHVPGSTLVYGGLDLGDQCWFVARAVETAPPFRARLRWIEPIAAERVRTRVPELFEALGLRALCVDAGPLRDLSRELAFRLNGLDEEVAVSSFDAARNIFFTREGATLPLRWTASAERWEGLRCVPVEFTQREGAGVRHKVARTQEGRLYPLLAAHREECISRVVGELLGGGVTEGADGVSSRAAGPRFLLPTATEATREVLDLYERHLLAGSRQEPTADGRSLRFLDQCENHFLLATAYAGLAELLAPVRPPERALPLLPRFRALGWPGSRARARRERSLEG